MEYYSVLKEMHYQAMKSLGGNTNTFLQSEGRQSEKATYYIIPTIWHSGKSKIMETVKRSMVVRSWEGGER